MVKDKKFLEKISFFCLDKAKSMGATDCEVVVSSSISESISLRNKQIDHSESSNNLSVAMTTYINKKKIKCFFIQYKRARFVKINR